MSVGGKGHIEAKDISDVAALALLIVNYRPDDSPESCESNASQIASAPTRQMNV